MLPSADVLPLESVNMRLGSMWLDSPTMKPSNSQLGPSEAHLSLGFLVPSHGDSWWPHTGSQISLIYTDITFMSVSEDMLRTCCTS